MRPEDFYPFQPLSQEEMEKVIREIKFQVDDLLRQSLAQLLPTSSSAPSPYSVLGLDPSAPDEVVELVYRHLAKRFHPDIPGGNAEAMARINRAYEEIMREKKGRPGQMRK